MSVKRNSDFFKNDIYFIKNALQIPDRIICYNRLVVSGVEATCILLKRFAYAIRFGNMVPRFGRYVPELSVIAAEMTNLVNNKHHHRLETFQQRWLAPDKFQRYANAIHDAGAPL